MSADERSNPEDGDVDSEKDSKTAEASATPVNNQVPEIVEKSDNLASTESADDVNIISEIQKSMSDSSNKLGDEKL